MRVVLLGCTMTYTIGELARRAGVKIETIRYYDRLKLFGELPRTQTGRRIFQSDDLETLLFIRHCREMLFSIENIRKLLPLRSKGPCHLVKSIAVEHLDELRTKVRLLGNLEKKLSEAVALCPGDESPACAILALLRAPEQPLDVG
jgi:MerR family mercuric resistance operon transcriptional regulator